MQSFFFGRNSLQSFGGGGSIKLSCIVWMTLVGLYHYRKTHSCRVSRPLPSDRPRALGKDEVCRVPRRGHSAKTWHTACPHFAECWPSAKKGTRQRPRMCPARAPAVRVADGVKSLLSASTWHSANLEVCRVPGGGTRQR